MDRLNELLNHYKLPIAFSFIGIVLIVGGIFFSNLLQKTKQQEFPKSSLVSEKDLSKGIKIDISGAVDTPGVYKLTDDSRVEDAIKVAGGFSEKASADYISKKLNLSAKLSDGQKIYIPFAGENYQAQLGVATQSTPQQTQVIGLNSGNQSELESLSGVGPSTAQKIINGRPYSDVNDLLIKKIVSKSVFEKIKNQVNLQ